MIEFYQFLLGISCLFIFLTSHPIYAVIYLIFLFCESSFILFLFNVEFLGLLLIIVYVGAIAVLFLFVVMLLNIKMVEELINHNFLLLAIALCIGLKWVLLNFTDYTIIKSYFFTNLTNSFMGGTFLRYDILTNLETFSQMIFNEYVFIVVIIGVVLLVPLLSAITLTFNYSNMNQGVNSVNQLSRGQKVFSLFS